MATLLQNTFLYQEANTACNEAIYESELFLQEEADAVNSNEDFKNVFLSFLKPMLSHPEYYTVNFYTVDFEKGLLDVGLEYNWYPWASKHLTDWDQIQKPKTLSKTLSGLGTIEYEEGMTWKDWVNSEYNDKGIRLYEEPGGFSTRIWVGKNITFDIEWEGTPFEELYISGDIIIGFDSGRMEDILIAETYDYDIAVNIRHYFV